MSCLGGGCALVCSGVVAADNRLHLTTVFRYFSEIGIFVISGSFLNWGYCLENNSL